LRRVKRDGMLPAGVVITGGGSKLLGAVDLAKESMRLPAQLGLPINLTGMVEKLNDDPQMVTAIGLMQWAGEILVRGGKNIGATTKQPQDASWSKIKDWLGQFLP